MVSLLKYELAELSSFAHIVSILDAVLASNTILDQTVLAVAM